MKQRQCVAQGPAFRRSPSPRDLDTVASPRVQKAPGRHPHRSDIVVRAVRKVTRPPVAHRTTGFVSQLPNVESSPKRLAAPFTHRFENGRFVASSRSASRGQGRGPGTGDTLNGSPRRQDRDSLIPVALPINPERNRISLNAVIPQACSWTWSLRLCSGFARGSAQGCMAKTPPHYASPSHHTTMSFAKPGPRNAPHRTAAYPRLRCAFPHR